MPTTVPQSPQPPPSPSQDCITKFTNCYLLKGGKLVYEDLWISAKTGKILDGQKVFYGYRTAPESVIDLGGKILSPGFIDAQLNGTFGFDFSTVPENITEYVKGLVRVNKSLVKHGVTSYLPTLPSQKSEVYHSILQYLGPSGHLRVATEGAESLGVHVEGPFISPKKPGVHKIEILKEPKHGIKDLEACYGPEFLNPTASPIKLITIAPELPGSLDTIPELVARGITVCIGHSACTYETARSAILGGARMITHLFNAMEGLHHRNPGIFGLLGTQLDTEPTFPKPFFGIIADGQHLHPTAINIAFHSHPDGFILVTDAMSPQGMPDGAYPWTNGEVFVKRGSELTMVSNGKLAGCVISLLDCVNNFINWSSCSVPEALDAVTRTPARMLGLERVKGTLEPGADADLVVLELDEPVEGWKKLELREVWKFGERVG
jgi:N-acetylglucosamine-6-phosphate deacetylase